MKKTIVLFCTGLLMMYVSIYVQHCDERRGNVIEVEKDVAYKNVIPVESIEINGETVELSDIQGFTIDVYPVARETYQENIYVLRTHGRVYEFPFDSRSDAEDIGIYICMLKGEGL